MTRLKSVPKNPGKRSVRSPVAPPLSEQPPPSRQRTRLYVEPQDVRGKADQLGALTPRIGGPLADMNYEEQSAQQDPYVLVVDPFVLVVGDIVHNDILNYPEVEQNSQVDPARHTALWQQVSGAELAYTGAVDREPIIDDNLAVVGKRNRDLRKKLRALIPHAQDAGLIPEAKRGLLRTYWRRIQAEEEKEAQKVQAARDQTKKEKEQAAADQARAQQREDLVNTIVDLKHGVNPDPVRAAQAVRTHDELMSEQQTAADAEQAGQAKKGKRGRTR